MDLGTKTLGLAISDKQGIIASPYKLIKYNNIEDAVNEVLEIIEKEKVDNLVLGLPKYEQFTWLCKWKKFKF